MDTQNAGRWKRALIGEGLCLAFAAPLLYFPGRFPPAGAAAGLALLLAALIWRRMQVGCWFVRTPVDWPLALFAFVMLPLSVLVAPSPLRYDYAVPRALIMGWNLALFCLVVTYAGRSSRTRLFFTLAFALAGTFIAAAALFGTQWVEKAPALAAVLGRIPSPLIGMFEGAESGFSPNQLAGSLLFVLPFSLAMMWAERHRRRWAAALLLAAAAVMGLVLIASQSRAGLTGFAVSLLVWCLVLWRINWRIILLFAAGAVAALLLLPLPALLLQIDAATAATSTETSISVIGRLEIWQRAVMALADFPLTGMGLGTFRATVHLLYPLFTIAPTTDIAHAHNFFLQTALDFGLPGLMAILSMYMLALVQSHYLHAAAPFAGSRYWGAAFVAIIAGTTVYSFFDAVAMGSKTNFLFWYFFALIFALSPTSPDYVQARRATGRSAC